MKKLSDILVKKRFYVLAVMLIITAISAVLMNKVNVNTDLAKYLPNDSSMKQGNDIMEDEFPEAETENTIRVMFQNLPEAEREQVTTDLAAIKYVTSVTYDSTSADYEKNVDGTEYSLYVVGTTYDLTSDEVKDIVSGIEDKFDGYYDMVYAIDNSASVPVMVFIMAVVILMIILFIMCASWIEPFLFLITIGIAVVINMGTNALLPSVSSTTNSIAAILQLVLSMDYSIILINRYRQELAIQDDKYEAMKRALRKGFIAITSSSVTTIVGLLALVFMSFKIGADMGIVLAKGVFISLLCIFTVLPVLILSCHKLIQKTSKKVLTIKMNIVGRFSYKFRCVLTGLFLVIFVAVFLLKGNTNISYTISDPTEIDDVFTLENPIVVIYDNDDDEAMMKIAATIAEDENVKSVNAYSNTIGAEMTASVMAQQLGAYMGTDSGMTLDESSLKLLYYMYYSEGKTGSMTLGEFMGFLSGLAENPELAASMDETTLAQLSQISAMPVTDEMLMTEYTASELAAFFSSLSAEVDESSLELLYMYYFSSTSYDDTWTMSMYDFVNFLTQTVSENEMFSSMMDEDSVNSLKDAQTQLQSAALQLKGETYSRMIITTIYPSESDETTEFMDSITKQMDDSLNDEYYLIGNTPMAYEMSHTFDDELNRITIITAVLIFIVVAISFKSLIIPLILVLLIQGGVYATIMIIGIQGYSIFFLALLIVQSILMGATIDYAILFTTYYKEARPKVSVKEALIEAYNKSIHTILTSGLIMVLVTGILSNAFSNPTIGQICETISKGALCAIILIVFILPGILASFDKLVYKKK